MLNTLAMIGMEPLLILLVVVLILFGGKKIPELMRGVGQGVGELHKGLEEGKRTIMTAAQAETPAPVAAPAVTPAEPVVDKPASSGSVS